MLERNGLKDKDISQIYASGMVTSPFGIKEVPHLKVPVGIEDLRSHIYNYCEDMLFKRQIGLIPGVKSTPDSGAMTSDHILEVNSMRGEEVEIFGLLSSLDDNVKSLGTVFLIPGSHTQMAYVRNQKITDLVSTISGELFYAISNHTIISSSIKKDLVEYDKEMVQKAFEMLRQYGFNKTVYLINTMKIFNVADNRSKTSFLEGAIFGGDIICLEKYLQEEWNDINRVVVYANNTIAAVYKPLLKMAGINLETTIIEKSKARDFAVEGFLEIFR